MDEYLVKFIQDLAILGVIVFVALFLWHVLRELFSLRTPALPFALRDTVRDWFPFRPRGGKMKEETTLLVMACVRCLAYYTSLWMIRFIDGDMRYPDVGAVYGTDTTLLEGLCYPVFLYLAARFLYQALRFLFSQRDAYWLALFVLLLPYEIFFGVTLTVPAVLLMAGAFLSLVPAFRQRRGKPVPHLRLPLSNRALENIWILVSFAGMYILLITRFYALK